MGYFSTISADTPFSESPACLVRDSNRDKGSSSLNMRNQEDEGMGLGPNFKKSPRSRSGPNQIFCVPGLFNIVRVTKVGPKNKYLAVIRANHLYVPDFRTLWGSRRSASHSPLNSRLLNRISALFLTVLLPIHNQWKESPPLDCSLDHGGHNITLGLLYIISICFIADVR